MDALRAARLNPSGRAVLSLRLERPDFAPEFSARTPRRARRVDPHRHAEVCADELLDRIHRANLPLHDIRLINWPGDRVRFFGSLHHALEAQPEWEIEAKLPEDLILLKTTTSKWHANRIAVLLGLLEHNRSTGDGRDLQMVP